MWQRFWMSACVGMRYVPPGGLVGAHGCAPLRVLSGQAPQHTESMIGRLYLRAPLSRRILCENKARTNVRALLSASDLLGAQSDLLGSTLENRFCTVLIVAGEFFPEGSDLVAGQSREHAYRTTESSTILRHPLRRSGCR